MTAIGALAAILLQDGFGARDQIGGRNDLVDEPDAIGLLRADHLSGQDELQGAALADQPRQPLRSAAARNESERDFGLAELRVSPTAILMVQAIAVSQPPPSAKPLMAAITGLPRFSMRSRTSCPKRLDCSASNAVDMRELADVGAGDERLVAGAGQDDAAHCGVVPRILEGGPQILPGRRIQGVEHLGPIDRHIGDRALLLVQDIRERQCCRWRSGGTIAGEGVSVAVAEAMFISPG